MKRFFQLLPIGLASLLDGCVTVNIQSNVKPGATPEFHRVLIESRLPGTSDAYLSRFSTAFPSGYQVCTLANGPTSFDNPAESLAKKRQACQSEVLLTIDFQRNYTLGEGQYISSRNELLLEMTNLETGQPFWKALVTTSGSGEVPPGRIVNKLIDDGLVESRLPGHPRIRVTN